jgi:hypothetical protein
MQDERLNNLLRDWANDQLPDDDTRDNILHSVLARSPRPNPASPARTLPKGEGTRRPLRWRIAAALSGIVAVAATILFLVTPSLPPEQIIDIPVVHNTQNDDQKIRISLIVLKQLPDSDTAVEFLEDTIFVAEKQQLYELELGGHRLFLWIYPLEETLFSLDLGIDNAAETGIVAVPDRPQALQFQSGGNCFDVFVSVLPFS